MTGRRGDSLRLADVERSIGRIEEVLATGYDSFSESWISQSAVIRELEIIGEAAGEVSATTRKDHPAVGWEKLHRFSSFARHEHWRVNPKLLWRAVEEMPALRLKIAQVSVP
jgi:uncharacterized protein with HEPN domain